MLQGVGIELGRLGNELAVEFFPLGLLVGALLGSGLRMLGQPRVREGGQATDALSGLRGDHRAIGSIHTPALPLVTRMASRRRRPEG